MQFFAAMLHCSQKYYATCLIVICITHQFIYFSIKDKRLIDKNSSHLKTALLFQSHSPAKDRPTYKESILIS